MVHKRGETKQEETSLCIPEKDQCSSMPCMNGGTCVDQIGDFNCTCPLGYGDTTCQTQCEINAFGVANNVMKIPDAQISGHLTLGTALPWEGRLSSTTGWIGNDTGSWLQIDLGEVRHMFAVATQGYHSSTYYTSSFKVAYSQDGNKFVYAQSKNSEFFKGSANYDMVQKFVLDRPVRTRFVRFLPELWHNGGHPGLRVEIYGCDV
ncbi:EDIL3-like protein [Mya arenaria]|uniref:EDIL3-like protein n=1 Tax=Mya arenaria TaxID=6604 RepID=A0ABY7FZ48_MYAAR|nr:EDIL3-like protein [Mya arenaria]